MACNCRLSHPAVLAPARNETGAARPSDALISLLNAPGSPCLRRRWIELLRNPMENSRNRVYGRLLSVILIAALSTMSTTIDHRLDAQQPSAHVPIEDSRNTEIRTTDTHLPLPEFTSLAAWEQRKAFLREQILISAGLSPMPEKSPLHAQIFGKFQEKDYTIEKVLIEPLPGFYLGGNLYRPRNGKAKHPGIDRKSTRLNSS